MEPQVRPAPTLTDYLYASPIKNELDESLNVVERLLTRSENRIAELIELSNMSSDLKLIHIQNIESMITAAIRQTEDSASHMRAHEVIEFCQHLRGTLRLS
ncbi:hypothetical protein ACFQDN_07925 [Pseudomonas asuensis]|jgi:hypothetical protein|uniref:Uncharacterized protein n=1 Tax=Pseudomonas asuensis TaxID=1825787 RepID=A0ABQ2GWY2_9PSED|nr:hypothetical protein [Pseudomonas asuensis]GGM15283.1 hypothetical protein GCM10009425_27750 [Pseudomonas asuensis]